MAPAEEVNSTQFSGFGRACSASAATTAPSASVSAAMATAEAPTVPVPAAHTSVIGDPGCDASAARQ